MSGGEAQETIVRLRQGTSRDERPLLFRDKQRQMVLTYQPKETAMDATMQVRVRGCVVGDDLGRPLK